MDNNRFPAIVVAKSGGRERNRRSRQSPTLVMSEVKDELDPPFEILEPAEWRGPVVFNSPHSGSVYPRAFLTASRLDMATLRRSEDSFVDELNLSVVRRGYPLMRAHFPRADVVLGDRYGTSCVAAVAETIEATLRAQGYSVSRNKPYAGGFITEHYGNPAAGLHAIQLELNRALYMDERRFERSPSFARLAADLETLADCLAAIPIQELRPYRAAAE